jgi:hypothetical protein
MTSSDLSSEIEVLHATAEDLEVAVQDAKALCGYSLVELEAQARANDFESLAARMTWVALGGLIGRGVS